LHGLALYGKTFCGSEAMNRTIHSSALLDKTVHGFSTAMQNF